MNKMKEMVVKIIVTLICLVPPFKTGAELRIQVS